MSSNENASTARSALWAVVWSWLVVLPMMAVFGYLTVVETSIDIAFRQGTLTRHQATVIDARYEPGSTSDGTGGSWGRSNGTLTLVLRLDNDSQVAFDATTPLFDVERGDIVVAGLWHDKLVTVDGELVRRHWGISALVFLFVPPLFVLAVLQTLCLYRVSKVRRSGEAVGQTSSLTALCVAVVLAMVSTATLMALDVVWWPPLAFAIATGASLVAVLVRGRCPS